MLSNRDRNELLQALATNYICEQENNKVWQRENSQGYAIALGKLVGACMAFSLDIEETDQEIRLLTRTRKKIVLSIKKQCA